MSGQEGGGEGGEEGEERKGGGQNDCRRCEVERMGSGPESPARVDSLGRVVWEAWEGDEERDKDGQARSKGAERVAEGRRENGGEDKELEVGEEEGSSLGKGGKVRGVDGEGGALECGSRGRPCPVELVLCASPWRRRRGWGGRGDGRQDGREERSNLFARG